MSMVTPTPMDQIIVNEVVRLLSYIRKANGYHTDAGAQIVSEETQSALDESQPILEVLDDDETTEFQRLTRRTGSLALRVVAYLPDAIDERGEIAPATRALARKVLADMRAALALGRPQDFPAGFTGLEIGGRTLFLREAGSRFFRPELQLKASFNEAHRLT